MGIGEPKDQTVYSGEVKVLNNIIVADSEAWIIVKVWRETATDKVNVISLIS